MRKKIMLAISASLSLSFAFAQDSLKTTTLQDVVVSATRMEQSIIETPRSVTVINRDVLEKSVYNSVGEILTLQQGVFVTGANQTPGSNQGLFMRGANSNQVVVMIDGLRINDPSSPNAALDLSEISLTDVERIEIIRGSHSTIFGGSAIGGVVNIITRKGSLKGFHGDASLQAGTFGQSSSAFTENVNLNYSFENGLYARGAIVQQNVNGLDASIKNQKPEVFTTADKDDFSKTDAQIKIGYNKNKLDAFVLYKKTDQRADIDQGAYADDENYYLDFNRNLWEYRAGYVINTSFSILASGSFTDSKRLAVNDSSVVDENGNTNKSYFKGKYSGELQTHELVLKYQRNRFSGIVGGGQYYENMFFNTYYFSNAFGPFTLKTNYDTLDTSAKTRYAFGQANYVFNNFKLSAGARLSHHSRFGSYGTFEVNPSYQIENTLLYASVSSGYNAPSLYQLFDPTKGFGSHTNKGNENLKPEKSLSFEVGVKKEFNSGSYFTVSAFETRTKNSIEYIYLWNGDKSIDDLTFADYRGDTYINISKYQVHGAEMGGQVFFNKQVFLNANVTLLRGAIEVSPTEIDTEYAGNHHVQLFSYGNFLTREVKNENLTRRPRLTSSAQLGYQPIKTLQLNVTYRYAGARYDVQYDGSLGPFGALRESEVKTYALVDFGVNWLVTKHLSIAGKVENILDEQYQEILGFQTRGRSGYIKLSVRW